MVYQRKKSKESNQKEKKNHLLPLVEDQNKFYDRRE
jgi:hypothetical protein